jgi:hypothetical protein
MNWKDLLKAQGYTDAEISKMETEFGGDKMSRAFSEPVRQLNEARQQLADAVAAKEDFEKFYQDEVLPKVSTVYQDAINSRTRAAALETRLKAAQEFGFLSDPKILDGIVPGTTVLPPNPVPGSPGAPGAPASGDGKPDPRYVLADSFARSVDSIPEMLANLTDISNQHYVLFGQPLPNVQEIVRKAKDSKGKLNVRTVWEQDYKVAEKRTEIDKIRQDAHDKQIADEAVRKYASEHQMPFSTPGRTSVAAHFTPKSSEEARQPWKDQAAVRGRRQERRELFMKSAGITPMSERSKVQ